MESTNQQEQPPTDKRNPRFAQRDWIILALLLAMGILTLPPGGDSKAVSAAISGVCFGAAAMLMVFRFGKKPPEDVM